MKSDQYFGELDLEKRKNRRMQIFLGLSVLIILIQTTTIRAQVGKERTTFLPPEITKPFWISSEEASPEYFEQMGEYVNGLVLNVTPETVGTRCDQFLTYILPRDRDAAKKKCDISVSRIKRDNASQMFSLRETRTDPKKHRVALIGNTATYISDKRVSNNSEAYLIEFAHADGRFYVSKQQLVAQDDPFGIKTTN